MVKLACVVLMCMVVTAPHAQAAINCPKVQSSFQLCLLYLRNGGAVPTRCCNRVRSLNSAAKTKADRQSACKCLKSAYNKVQGIKAGYASSLPKNCGVNIPYQIRPDIDCTKVN